MIKRIVEKAKIENKKIYLFVHKNADNDALNSATVLLQYFLEQGIETKFVYLDSNASIKRFSLLKEYKTKEVEANNISVILDTSALNMLDTDLYKFSKKEDIYVIDHHIKGDKNIEGELELSKYNYIRDDKESSCCEVLLNHLDNIPDSVIKNILYGLLGDTGNLKFIKENTFNNLINLINRGISYEDILSKQEYKFNLNTLIGINKLLKKIDFIKVGNSFITVLKVDKKDKNDLICNYNFKQGSKIINYFTKIDNCPLFICLEEDGDEYEVSLRSTPFYANINVWEIANKFGGGGHHNASGMRLSKDNLDSFLEFLIESFKDVKIDEIYLKDNDYELLELLKKTDYLSNVTSNDIFLKLLKLINNNANYNYLINRYLPLNLFFMQNEIISNLDKDSKEIIICLSKEECEYYCKKYNCTLDDILECIDCFKNVNIDYVNIKLYNGKERKIGTLISYNDNSKKEKELNKNI